MNAKTRVKKALTYLDNFEFLLSDRLMRVRNSMTLLKGSLIEIERLEARNKALEEMLLK